MQSRKYRIAGRVIELKVPFPFAEQEQFLPFRCEGRPDIVIEFKLCRRPPENMGELIHSSDIHVFRKGTRLCIEHFLSVRVKPYAWLYWDEADPGKMECLILEEDTRSRVREYGTSLSADAPGSRSALPCRPRFSIHHLSNGRERPSCLRLLPAQGNQRRRICGEG